MSGSEVASIIVALGGILTALGGGVGWFVKRIDDKVARLERRIRRLERHKFAAIHHITTLEVEIVKMGGTPPRTDGWPPDDEDDDEDAL